MRDPRVVAKYNAVLENEFERRNVYERALDLYNQFKSTLTPEQCVEYDLLDQDRIEAMRYAERSCRHIHMGAVPWSPEIQLTMTTILYITLTIRRKLGRSVSARYLIRLSQKVGMNLEHATIPDLEELKAATKKTYKFQKKNATNLQATFLEYLAEALEKDGQGKKASIVKQILCTESQRERWMLPWDED